MKILSDYEHRAFKRYEIPLKLSYLDPLTNDQGEATAKDFSKSGLRFAINSRIPKGRTLNLEIESPYSNKFVSSKVKVIWIKQFVAGDDAEKVFYEIGVKLLRKRLY